jgi:sigma-B regulation protein RsbU (phosphoserine phosphatase)
MITEWEHGVRDPVRLAAVRRSGLVGLPPEDAFDRLIELAAELTGAPRACITLVDATHTSAMSSVGFPLDLTLAAPIEVSFCRFVVASGLPLVVDDSRHDPRTMSDPAIEASEAGAWAGYPVEDAGGQVIGTFCVMGPTAHAWTSRDLHVLATLAMAASTEIALRQARAEVKAARWEVERLRAARGEPVPSIPH